MTHGLLAVTAASHPGWVYSAAAPTLCRHSSWWGWPDSPLARCDEPLQSGELLGPGDTGFAGLDLESFPP